MEYAKSGIRVGAVCPDVIRTPVVEHAAEARFAALEVVGYIEAGVWLCPGTASCK